MFGAYSINPLSFSGGNITMIMVNTRHIAVGALGLIAAVFGITGAEFSQSTQVFAALIALFGGADWIKARIDGK